MWTFRIERKLIDGRWIPISYMRCQRADIREMINRVTETDAGPMPIRIRRQKTPGDTPFDGSLPTARYSRGGTVTREG